MNVETVQLLQEDIDNAVEFHQDRTNTSTSHCVVAQALSRHYGKPISCGYTEFVMDEKRYRMEPKIRQIVEAFDYWVNYKATPLDIQPTEFTVECLGDNEWSLD